MSIKREQFDLQIQRLEDTFGEKNFSDQRVHMIWESVSRLPYPAVIAIVDQFIRSAKHAPLPADFAVAANGMESSESCLGELRDRKLAQCWDCGDSGFVVLIRRETYEPWAKAHRGQAPCHCVRGRDVLVKARNPRDPRNRIEFNSQYGPEWESSYQIEKAYTSTTTTLPKE